jgi:hypothetical protein
MMDKRYDGIGMPSLVCKNQGGVIEFILKKEVQVGGKSKMQVVGQVSGIISPGQGNDFDSIPLQAQIFDYLRSYRYPPLKVSSEP